MYVTREGLVLRTLYILTHAHNDPLRRGIIITPTLQMYKLRFRETIPRLYRWRWVSNRSGGPQAYMLTLHPCLSVNIFRNSI